VNPAIAGLGCWRTKADRLSNDHRYCAGWLGPFVHTPFTAVRPPATIASDLVTLDNGARITSSVRRKTPEGDTMTLPRVLPAPPSNPIIGRFSLSLSVYSCGSGE